jgi:hypothetical protein
MQLYRHFFLVDSTPCTLSPHSREAAAKRLMQRLIPLPLRLAHARHDLSQCHLKVLNEQYHATCRHILLDSSAARIQLLQRCPARARALVRLPRPRLTAIISPVAVSLYRFLAAPTCNRLRDVI